MVLNAKEEPNLSDEDKQQQISDDIMDVYTQKYGHKNIAESLYQQSAPAQEKPSSSKVEK